MVTRAEIESYLVRMGLPFKEVAECVWTVSEEGLGGTPVVITHDPTLTVFRIKLMDEPKGNVEGLFRKLLELNASEMVSGAYGLEDGSVVAVETLQSENLDFNEFQAAVESLMVAMTEHYPVLRELRGAA